MNAIYSQPAYSGVQDSPADRDQSPLQLALDTAQHLQESPAPEPELTDAEKHALAEHWQSRDCPHITLGRGLYFNLRILLSSTDPYLARKRLEHAARLRRLLARWENADAPASHNEDGGET